MKTFVRGVVLFALASAALPNRSAAQCVLTAPANVTTTNASGQCGNVVNYAAPTASGTCGTISCSPPSGAFYPVGTTTVTCTDNPSTVSVTHTITVNDAEPPALVCPANIQARPTDWSGGVVSYPAPTVSDNCPNIGVTTCAPASGSLFPPSSTTTVTCSTHDFLGNAGSCTFAIAMAGVPVVEVPTLRSAGIVGLALGIVAVGLFLLARGRS